MFSHSVKRHALYGRSDSTPRIITLGKSQILTNINCGKTQVLIQIAQIGAKLSSLLFIARANTHALAQRVAAMLKKTKTNPKCSLSDGTILHGPSFKNFAIPNDPEKTEIANVTKNRFC